MDVLDSAINRRAMEGELPKTPLYPASAMDRAELNFDELSASAKSYLQENPYSLHMMFSTLTYSISVLKNIDGMDLSDNEINCWINTGCDANALKAKTYIDACSLNPAITLLDKVLWIGAIDYQMSNGLFGSDTTSMMFAWIQMLRSVQKKELVYKKTIKESVLSSFEDIFNIIVSDWSQDDLTIYCGLATDEVNGLSHLFEKRAKLESRIKEESEIGLKVARQTEGYWGIAINYINDLSTKETDVINCIINEYASAKDKIGKINEYNSILTGIDHGHYSLNDEEIQLVDVYKPINERMNNAPMQSRVSVAGGDSFRVSPVVFALGLNPRTYNYVFISFHQFRLSPSKETAKIFMTEALNCIRKNLGEPEKKCISIKEIIADFQSVVTDFVNNHKASIDTLSFEMLQKDGVTQDKAFVGLTSSDMIMQSLGEDLKKVAQNSNWQKQGDDAIIGHDKHLTREEIITQVNRAEEAESQADSKALARQLVISLNIIYLFCDVLRIILTNKSLHIKINENEVKKCRNNLQRLDQDLVYKVYSSMGKDEIGMLEYREASGIDARTLTEQENQAEALRDEAFSGVLKSTVTALIDDIDHQNVEQIVGIKKSVKEEIMRFPACDQKGQYAEWLDSISDKICCVLIEKCKEEKHEYKQIKQMIISKLGEDSKKLPISTLDSLATAELLYGQYASKRYAEEGFDYSCISALYYQAFEDAYNDLIWAGYADKLNTLVVGDSKYTEILEGCKKTGVKINEAKGYLDPDPKTRGFYVEYKTKVKQETKVKRRCMYKSFSIIMDSIKQNSKIKGFCEYFASLVGFEDITNMFNDSIYMKACREFSLKVSDSTNNRNNASHGGSYISVDQCTKDKATVLHDLEQVRADSIGLIQQLLFLLYGHNIE